MENVFLFPTEHVLVGHMPPEGFGEEIWTFTKIRKSTL